MTEEPDSSASARPGPSGRGDLIYHIARVDDWVEAEAESVYRGGALCRADGFIHFSTARQVAGTLERFFSEDEDLLLLAAEVGALGDALKWESGPGGASYPHYYGALAIDKLRVLGYLRRGGGSRTAPPAEPKS